MAIVSYQVTIASNGKPTVSVTTEDPDAAQDAIPWLAQTYAKLLSEAKAVARPATAVLEELEGDAPICAVHQLPMARVSGRKGPFWSCHQKNADDSWCSYKPALG